MPSPFPGMDPYLECPRLWRDFHDAFASELRALLNRHLPPTYFAQLNSREEISIFDEPRLTILPDVGIREKSWSPSDGGVAVLDDPQLEISEHLVVDAEDLEVPFVEIFSSATHEVVTVIEILSPSNKKFGADRDSYMEKRNAVLKTRTSLIEIDLLRKGDRTLFGFDKKWFGPLPRSAPADYVVFVHEGWRQSRISSRLFRISVSSRLPVIPIPLSESEPLMSLDLQEVFNETYDGGPYRRGSVNYDAPPEIPLAEQHEQWARDCITRWRQPATS